MLTGHLNEGSDDEAFLRVFLVDALTRCFLAVHEESLKSREVYKQNRVSQLEHQIRSLSEQLHKQKQNFEFVQAEQHRKYEAILAQKTELLTRMAAEKDQVETHLKELQYLYHGLTSCERRDEDFNRMAGLIRQTKNYFDSAEKERV